MKKIFSFLMACCLMYFFGGWIVVKLGYLDLSLYLNYAGIIGGIASAIGLYSLIRPSITRSDIQNLELDALTSLGETSRKLDELENKRSKAAGEISELEIKKEQMQFLVKKASLQLFLQEQYKIYEKRILDALQANEELSKNMNELATIKSKLMAVDKEIEEDPNVELLNEIVRLTKQRPLSIDDRIKRSKDPIELISLFIIKAFRQLDKSIKSQLPK